MSTEKFKFKNFIKKRSLRIPNTLHLTHLTEFYYIIDILEKGELSPTPCKIFNEDLLYFFYGRPAYRIGKSKTNTAQKAFHPLCFIFEYTKMPNIERIFPFDTGGFGYYKNYIHPNMKLENFEMEKTLDNINDLVNFFYDDEKEYFDDNPKEIDTKKLELAFEIDSYYSMIKNRSLTNDDERNSTIEIQTKEKISLKNLKTIIIPKQDETLIKKMLQKKRINCEVKSYYLSGITNPNDYFSEIKNIVRSL